MRDRRSGAERRPTENEDETNPAWKLAWVVVGAVAFTLVMLLLDLI